MIFGRILSVVHIGYILAIVTLMSALFFWADGAVNVLLAPLFWVALAWIFFEIYIVSLVIYVRNQLQKSRKNLKKIKK